MSVSGSQRQLSPTKPKRPTSAHPCPPPSHQTKRRYNTRQRAAQQRLSESNHRRAPENTWAAESQEVADTASSSLTPLPTQDQIVPPSSPRLSSLDRQLEFLAFGASLPRSTPASLQHRHRVSCSVPSSQPEPLVNEFFTPTAPGDGCPSLSGNVSQRLQTYGSYEPPAAQPRHDSFFLDKRDFSQPEEDAAPLPPGEDLPPVDLNAVEHSRINSPGETGNPFVRQTALQGLFEESQNDEDVIPSNLAPVSSLFDITEYSLRRRRKHRHTQARRASNPDLDNYPRLTFTTRSTPSPSKNAQSSKPATNKPAKAFTRRMKQQRSFPSRLKPINRSALKIKKGSSKSSQSRRVEIEFFHDEAVELLSQLKKRHQRSASNHNSRAPLRRAFAPSEDGEAIQTPPLPPTPRHDTRGHSRNAKMPRLDFAQKPATQAASTPAPPAPSRIPNSCPSQASSVATHTLASLCGTASLRRYKLLPPPSLPSGMSTPPVIDVDQEIEMWEEEEKCSRQREMTPPDDIIGGMASWDDVPNENQPPGSQGQAGHDRTTPAARKVLGDITSQFQQPPPPSMSGVDLTAHLMSLVERLEPSRGTPRRRRQAGRSSETQQPPHRAVRSSSFSSRDLGMRPTRTQPPPMRGEGGSQLVLRPSTVPGLSQGATDLEGARQYPGARQYRPDPPGHSASERHAALPGQPPLMEETERVTSGSANAPPTSMAPRRSQRDRHGRADSAGVWSEFKQPSRGDATPPAYPNEVDIRHAELAEKFASFAAYIKQHEERAPPPPVLGTRIRTLSLRSTRSLGHTDSHMLSKRTPCAATQGPMG